LLQTKFSTHASPMLDYDGVWVIMQNSVPKQPVRSLAFKFR
jgi:hypothetical protein